MQNQLFPLYKPDSVSHRPGVPYLVTALQCFVVEVHAFRPEIIRSPVSLAPLLAGAESVRTKMEAAGRACNYKVPV